MLTIRRILVPVDFSPPSRAALEYAASLAERVDATLLVLHAWEPPAYLGTEGVVALPPIVVHPGEDEVRRAVEREVAQFVAGVELAPGSEVRVVRALPEEAILAAGAEDGVDLIVMGTHGRSGLARVVLGSVAEHVLRHAPHPVLTVRVS